MDTNYKLTAEHVQRAREYALMLCSHYPAQGKGFALLQAARHKDGSLAATFWQRVAAEADNLELLCGQPA